MSTRCPWTQIHFWGFRSLPPTLSIIGTKAAEWEAGQRPPRAGPTPDAPLKRASRPTGQPRARVAQVLHTQEGSLVAKAGQQGKRDTSKGDRRWLRAVF